MNLQEIKELIQLINQTDIAEVSLESAGVKVAIRKNGAGNGVPAEYKPTLEGTANMPVDSIPVTTEKAAYSPAPVKPVNMDGLHQVTAPMVGTFYQAPAPDAPPFVKVGDFVEKGQTLCIVEAMKLMNEIEADIAGEVVDVLVTNNDPVEYGQTLFLIKPKH